ncbi:unnamed protein product [Heterobilharzia americana]|nr:unnamed protein product [Heterobilharzia americana]
MRKEYTIILSLVLLFAVFNVVGQAVETAENTSTANGLKQTDNTVNTSKREDGLFVILFIEFWLIYQLILFLKSEISMEIDLGLDKRINHRDMHLEYLSGLLFKAILTKMRKEFTFILSLILLFGVFNVIGGGSAGENNSSTGSSSTSNSAWTWTKIILTAICTLNNILSYFIGSK